MLFSRRSLLLTGAAVAAAARVEAAVTRSPESSVADVVVIGAGLSGLSAALALQEAGLDVLVLEAQRRIGGKVFTFRNAPGNPEAGGQSIGPGYGRVIDVARRFEPENAVHDVSSLQMFGSSALGAAAAPGDAGLHAHGRGWQPEDPRGHGRRPEAPGAPGQRRQGDRNDSASIPCPAACRRVIAEFEPARPAARGQLRAVAYHSWGMEGAMESGERAALEVLNRV